MAQASNQTAEYSEYNQAQKVTFAQAVAFAILYFRAQQAQENSDTQWFSLIRLLFPYVRAYRDQSSRNARAYYDTVREKFQLRNVLDLDRLLRRGGSSTAKIRIFPSTPDAKPDESTITRLPIFLANYEPERLHEALEPVRERFQRENTSDGAVTHAAGIIGKEVLNGGRQTIIQAVPRDSLRPKFARVQGGNESCAFCWMLISRGPVYESEASAGGLGNSAGFHPNCDCRVVPVFDADGDWPGKDDFLAAEELWKESTKGLSGTSRGYRTPDAYRAFRRALGDGVKGPGNPELPVPRAA